MDICADQFPHAFMCIFVVGHQRIILTGVLTIVVNKRLMFGCAFDLNWSIITKYGERRDMTRNTEDEN